MDTCYHIPHGLPVCLHILIVSLFTSIVQECFYFLYLYLIYIMYTCTPVPQGLPVCCHKLIVSYIHGFFFVHTYSASVFSFPFFSFPLYIYNV